MREVLLRGIRKYEDCYIYSVLLVLHTGDSVEEIQPAGRRMLQGTDARQPHESSSKIFPNCRN